ncbi:hypothetical protein DFP72DRAFT_822985, partial [Ephemerocybe angulata]
SEKKEAAAKEQMEFLIKAANAKLDTYQAEMNAMFTDPATVEKVMVPGVRAMRWKREVRVDVKLDSAKGGLGQIIDGFFEAGSAAASDDKNKKDGVAHGLQDVVFGAITAILGSAAVGETQQECFFVYVEHNTVIRIDVRIWKYAFSSTGVMATSDNVLGYIFCTSVVDSSKLHVDELTYLLSAYAGDDEVDPYIQKLLKTWTAVAGMRAALKQLEAPAAVPATSNAPGHKVA